MSETENTTPGTNLSGTQSQSATEVVSDNKKGKSKIAYIIAIIVVIGILLGVLYQLEKQGRSQTGIFDTLFERQAANAVVATVNGETIIGSQLATGIQQFNQAAVAQGVDTADPSVQTDIRNQALQVLINTTLLKQEAAERGISVTDEAAKERLEKIETDIGGVEVLAERMAALGITEEQLHRDIKDEILIENLLEQVFAESDMEISEEEILAVYDGAGGEAAGLPALEEVRAQVVAQINASKEQAAIDEFLASLKEESTIEVTEE